MFYWNLLYYTNKYVSCYYCIKSFNPCFIGTYSITYEKYKKSIIRNEVLILVLLELTLLQVHMLSIGAFNALCFNPCFIGTYSITMHLWLNDVRPTDCFNPCFIGTYSITH